MAKETPAPAAKTTNELIAEIYAEIDVLHKQQEVLYKKVNELQIQAAAEAAKEVAERKAEIANSAPIPPKA